MSSWPRLTSKPLIDTLRVKILLRENDPKSPYSREKVYQDFEIVKVKSSSLDSFTLLRRQVPLPSYPPSTSKTETWTILVSCQSKHDSYIPNEKGLNPSPTYLGLSCRTLPKGLVPLPFVS